MRMFYILPHLIKVLIGKWFYIPFLSPIKKVYSRLYPTSKTASPIDI